MCGGGLAMSMTVDGGGLFSPNILSSDIGGVVSTVYSWPVGVVTVR